MPVPRLLQFQTSFTKVQTDTNNKKKRFLKSTDMTKDIKPKVIKNNFSFCFFFVFFLPGVDCKMEVTGLNADTVCQDYRRTIFVKVYFF